MTMGTVFGRPGGVARRISIHRATTMGPSSALCQVIIKNTSAMKDLITSSSSVSVNRSQSLLSTNRIAIVSPFRGDRIRLENLLSDVWTREVLPYPGMMGRGRGENIVRASASSMMRKLSVASIASNFTKRSGSLASMASFTRPAEDSGSSHPHLYAADSSFEGSHRIEGHSDASNPRPTTPKSIPVRGTKIISEEQRARAVIDGVQDDSPMGTVKRLATLRKKRVYSEGSLVIMPPNPPNPPLRTSSANSTKPLRPYTANMPVEGNENRYQPKHLRWPTANALHKGKVFTKESLKNFFR